MTIRRVTHLADSTAGSQPSDWENPEVVGRNKEIPRATAFCQSLNDAQR